MGFEEVLESMACATISTHCGPKTMGVLYMGEQGFVGYCGLLSKNLDKTKKYYKSKSGSIPLFYWGVATFFKKTV